LIGAIAELNLHLTIRHVTRIKKSIINL